MEEFWTCAWCGRSYPYTDDWTEEDRIKEFKENFGCDPQEDDELVCDDCYPLFLTES